MTCNFSFLAVLLVCFPVSAYTVCLDPGHGGNDPGAIGIYYTEKAANLDCAFAARSYMEQTAEIEWVGMTRLTDVYISLADRVDYANSNAFDRFLSLHHNAYNGSVQGTETYCYTDGPPEAFDLRDYVHPWLIWAFDYYDRGVKTADFYVLHYTNMPSILGEASFIDYNVAYNESWRFDVHWQNHDGREGYGYCAGLSGHMGYNPPDYESIAVDNSYPRFYCTPLSDWNTGDYGNPFGPDYRWTETGDIDDHAKWTPCLPSAGYYDVFAWWVAGTNRAEDALFTIFHENGYTEIRVDQTLCGEQWNFLGSFPFPEGIYGWVNISDFGCIPGRVVIADAVLFTPSAQFLPEEFPESRDPIEFVVHPNPGSCFSISVIFPEPVEIALNVFDITGRLVDHLYSGNLPEGQMEFTWNPHELDTGIYFITVSANCTENHEQIFDTRSIVLTR